MGRLRWRTCRLTLVTEGATARMTAQKRMVALRMVEERTRGLSGGSNCGSTKSRRGRWRRGRACPTADLHYFAPWPPFQTSMRRREHLVGKGATQKRTHTALAITCGAHDGTKCGFATNIDWRIGRRRAHGRPDADTAPPASDKRRVKGRDATKITL